VKRFGLLLLLGLSVPAFAGPTVPGALNSDNSFDTEFRPGDKPIAGGSCPTGWTCAVKGDATEDIDEVSATSFTIVASGTNDEGNIAYAYKSTGTDNDVEVIARIPATWTGHLENSTQFGVGLTEGTGGGAYATQCYWRNIGTSVTMKSDAGGAGEAQQAGLSNQALPRYIGIQYDDSATTISCWESTDGFEWTQIGTDVTKSLTFPVLGYVYGTSHEATATTTATLTSITHLNTLTIDVDGGGGGGGANVAPVWQSTPIITGTAGQAKSIVLANVANTSDCTKRVCDTNADALTLTERDCTWPTGVTVNDAGDTVEIATNAVAGTTANCKIGASDGIAARADSNAFSIAIDPAGGGEEDATIIWYGLLEGGPNEIVTGHALQRFKKKTGFNGQQSVVTSGVGCAAPRQGTYMAKLEIPAGASGTPQRGEILSNPKIDFLWDGPEYWVGFSFCVPAWAPSVNTLFQIHAANEDPGDCDFAGNAVGIMGQGNLAVIENPSGISAGSGANSNQIDVYDFNLSSGANQDVWHDVILNFSLSTTGNGFYNFWHNGVLVASDTGANNTNWKDSCGNVIQPDKDRNNGIHVGLYQGNTTPRIIYYDAMRVAEGDSGYNTVDPAQDD